MCCARHLEASSELMNDVGLQLKLLLGCCQLSTAHFYLTLRLMCIGRPLLRHILQLTPELTTHTGRGINSNRWLYKHMLLTMQRSSKHCMQYFNVDVSPTSPSADGLNNVKPTLRKRSESAVQKLEPHCASTADAVASLRRT